MAHDARDAEQVLTKLFSDALDIAGVLCQREIQFGGPLSGAPGQPVDRGDLLRDWVREREGWRIRIGNSREYATPIENGVGPHGPLTLRSEVGGFHSVKKVVASIDRIYGAALAAAEQAG